MRDTFKFSAQPVTILLVDDDEDCRQLIRDAIEQGKLDNPVYEVASGEEANSVPVHTSCGMASPTPR